MNKQISPPPLWLRFIYYKGFSYARIFIPNSVQMFLHIIYPMMHCIWVLKSITLKTHTKLKCSEVNRVITLATVQRRRIYLFDFSFKSTTWDTDQSLFSFIQWLEAVELRFDLEVCNFVSIPFFFFVELRLLKQFRFCLRLWLD